MHAGKCCRILFFKLMFKKIFRMCSLVSAPLLFASYTLPAAILYQGPYYYKTEKWEKFPTMLYMCDQQSLRSACAYGQSDQSLCKWLEYSMIVKLQTEHHLEFVSLKGGCRGSSESTHVKKPHCWKSHSTAHIIFSLISAPQQCENNFHNF